ncbi:MAG: hypothetical protein COX61_00405 [Candidatus Brennerbacteria bacterium CG_4_10_14_0_2_um_filter_43_14]|nr:MAG: hypothetical protein COX61_00405 [Candidatus Brennerbacteria bacterium CG_4_10_14_0_2_um_filter_43_14]
MKSELFLAKTLMLTSNAAPAARSAEAINSQHTIWLRGQVSFTFVSGYQLACLKNPSLWHAIP